MGSRRPGEGPYKLGAAAPTPPPSEPLRPKLLGPEAASRNLHHRKILLTRPTPRTHPILRNVLPPRHRCERLIRINIRLIADITAQEALPLLEFRAHPTFHCSGNPYSVPFTPERISIFPPG